VDKSPRTGVKAPVGTVIKSNLPSSTEKILLLTALIKLNSPLEAAYILLIIS
jgi:hypothetical protein